MKKLIAFILLFILSINAIVSAEVMHAYMISGSYNLGLGSQPQYLTYTPQRAGLRVAVLRESKSDFVSVCHSTIYICSG